MTTVTERLEALNGADLTQLRARIDQARRDLEDALKLQGKNPNQTATEKEMAAAAKQAGVSVEEFLAALEYAKRMGLI